MLGDNTAAVTPPYPCEQQWAWSHYWRPGREDAAISEAENPDLPDDDLMLPPPRRRWFMRHRGYGRLTSLGPPPQGEPLFARYGGGYVPTTPLDFTRLPGPQPQGNPYRPDERLIDKSEGC